jgi:hypothetical protein
MNAYATNWAYCVALIGSLLTVACGPSKFAGSSKLAKTPEVITPVTSDQSPKTPVANEIKVTESFKQLRSGNSGSAQAYGVGLISLTATGLLQGQKIISVERTGMSADVRFVQCQTTGEPAASALQDATQLFSQTMDCFLIFKGLKTPASVHRSYPGINRVALIGSADVQSNFSSTAALCVLPQGDTSEPCVEKSGRTVLKDIILGKSVGDMGHEALPFPDDATIEADLKSRPK